MDLKKELHVLLITYNRKHPLQNMLDCIFAENSPIRECDITILDNCSTDGTSEVLSEYAQKYSNVTHVRHKYNVGGDANLVKAMELADSSKKYCWFLCDDDYLDWTHWDRIQQAIDKDFYDMIQVGCPAHMEVASENEKERLAVKLIQMTWVPSMIYRTSKINSNVVTNAYFVVCALFPIMALAFSIINEGGHVFLTDAAETILYQPNYLHDGTYTRGMNYSQTILPKRTQMSWQSAYAMVVEMLKDSELKGYCIKHFTSHGTQTFEGFLHLIGGIC